MIAHIIMAAQKAVNLDDYLVTSEDDEIIEIAQRYGAPVPFKRPVELAGDEVRNIDTVRHALEFMEGETGAPYDIVVLLQPTCPIRDPRHIDEAVTRLWASPLDTLASVKGPFKKRDPILKRIADGMLLPYCQDRDPEHNEPFFLYNASIYAAKRDYFVANNKLISTRQIALEMERYCSIDIDEEEDLAIAELFFDRLKQPEPSSSERLKS